MQIIRTLFSSLIITLFASTIHTTLAHALSMQYIGEDIELYGEWTQGGIIRGKLLNKDVSGLSINQQPVHIRTQDTPATFVFGFGRDAKPEQILSYTKNQKTHSQSYTIQQRTYQVQRINGLPKSKVSVDEKHLERIHKEYALAKKARTVHSSYHGFTQYFIPPLSGIITGVYGSQRILNGKPRRPHFGIDIAAPTGTPVLAPADGVITLTHKDMFFSGGTLIMNHGLGLSSTFLHLHKILVTQGQQVKQGQVIAEVGATGRVTGAHLDWRMNWLTQRVDPSLILDSHVRENFLNNATK